MTIHEDILRQCGMVHDYAREERVIDEDTTEYRMHCVCGKTSRWSELTMPLMRAQDRHADEVAG